MPSAHTGVARVLAVVEHGVQNAGNYGVPLFFLLSSFLITRLLTAERERTGSIHLQKFYVRRGLRILPLYFLVILIGLLLPLWIASVPRLGAPRLAAACLFLLNWYVALHGFVWNPTFPLWTVSCEEQFYVVWPLLMRSISGRQMRRACLIAAGLILAIAFWPHGVFEQRLGPYTAAIFVYFPIGGLLAINSFRIVSRWQVSTTVAAATGGLVLWFAGASVDLWPAMQRRPMWLAFISLVFVVPGSVLLFHAWYRSGIRWPKPVIYLGKISYGLYVFHVPCMLIISRLLAHTPLVMRTGQGHSSANLVLLLGARAPLSLGLTILVSVLSYQIFETPFLRLKDRFALVQTRPV